MSAFRGGVQRRISEAVPRVQLGAVSLSPSSSLPHNRVPQRFATLLFYPPSDGIRPAGVTGKGRVLVCSNYHWLCDAHYWNGGFIEEANNRRLLLNLIAAGVAARVRPSLV